jgi:undecaprenyl-phosphate 4-deoxy-4-formamido-L-arabinose transferase
MTQPAVPAAPAGGEKPYLSVIIPVYNEEENLPELGRRLFATLNGLAYKYEIIFVDDGSVDRSWDLISQLHLEHPDKVRGLQFIRNFGQHPAIFAGFQSARGEVIVTLDADLQNPPEEIPKLVAKLAEGYDTVGGWREVRRDSFFRRLPSAVINWLMSKVTGVHLHDYGCMLRAYRREVIDSINQCHESTSFIPALANMFARRITEVPVQHAERTKGQSKYSLVKLIRLNFDFMTGFSHLPIHAVGVLGLIIALVGLGFGVFLILRRLWGGPGVEGVFPLFSILFVFAGLQMFGLALIGEYVGRIYREVRQRPRFVVREELGNSGEMESTIR